MSEPRKVWAEITYLRKRKVGKKTRSRNVKSGVVAEFTNGFTYTDCAAGESDTISVQMINADKRWMNSWMPLRGDKLSATITTKNWDREGEKKKLNCGRFCLDDISLSGPELTCEIGGVSVPEYNGFRATQRTRKWKKITVKELARRIGKRYKMKIRYYGKRLRIGVIEQKGETDCSFLNKVCKNYGMALKVYSGKLVLYDKGRFEAKKVATTLRPEHLIDWSYNTTLTGTYTGARIKYKTGSSKKKKEYTLKVGSGKRIYVVSETANSRTEARRIALSRVNEENEKAVTMTMQIVPNFKVAAGNTIRLSNFQKLSGKYFVDKVTHTISSDSEYQMSVDVHKCQRRLGAGKKKKKK